MYRPYPQTVYALTKNPDTSQKLPHTNRTAYPFTLASYVLLLYTANIIPTITSNKYIRLLYNN